LTLLEQARWFPGVHDLISLPPEEIRLPTGLVGRPVRRKWTTGSLAEFLAALHDRSWVVPVATVDRAGLGADDTPERALLDYLGGGLPPLWNSRREGIRNVVLAGTVTGPGGIVVLTVEGAAKPRFQVIERLVTAVREILLIVPARKDR
jgi:hypothetical protein